MLWRIVATRRFCAMHRTLQNMSAGLSEIPLSAAEQTLRTAVWQLTAQR